MAVSRKQIMKPRPLAVTIDAFGEFTAEKAALEPVADVQLLQTANESDIQDAAHIDVMVVQDIRITERTIGRLTKCRAIVRSGVGVDNIDLQAAGRRGIVVCNVPDYGTEEVADHALLLLLAVARRLVPAQRAISAGGWDLSAAYGTPRLRGKTLGLIGCGRIGTAMALRGKALGMRVIFHDPYRPDGLEKALGIERCQHLEELLPQAQFLSLHCPLTAETRHIVNTDTLARLPRGAYVINTARGPCVDQRALVAALDSGHITAAGLDVVEREPLDDDALRHHPRVLLTPHSAFYSVEGDRERRTKGAEEARRTLCDEQVRNPVNLYCLVSPRCAVPRLAPSGELSR
jgi:phosphoglycerate dehydrogenase-like enzyme